MKFCPGCQALKDIQDFGHFHHLDPNSKELEIGNGSHSFRRLQEEAKKCILVCANCHAELEDQRINASKV